MRTEKGGVMTLKEMEQAGLPLPEYEDEEEDVGGRKIRVVKMTPASGTGIYKPETGKVIEFPKKPKKEDNEELPKAA